MTAARAKVARVVRRLWRTRATWERTRMPGRMTRRWKLRNEWAGGRAPCWELTGSTAPQQHLVWTKPWTLTLLCLCGCLCVCTGQSFCSFWFADKDVDLTEVRYWPHINSSAPPLGWNIHHTSGLLVHSRCPHSEQGGGWCNQYLLCSVMVIQSAACDSVFSSVIMSCFSDLASPIVLSTLSRASFMWFRFFHSPYEGTGAAANLVISIVFIWLHRSRLKNRKQLLHFLEVILNLMIHV